jgi:hypothetical protein
MGDSHVVLSINDTLLNNSKNVATIAEPIYLTFYKLERLIKLNKNINTVYLGFSYHILSKYSDEFIKGEFSSSIVPKYFFILPINERAKLLKWNLKNFSVFNRALFKEIFFEISHPDANFLGGFSNNIYHSRISTKSIQKRIEIQYYTNRNLCSYSAISEEYLNKMIALCKDNNINLIIINTPLHQYYREMIPSKFIFKYNEIISKNNLNTIDFSTLALDDSSYTADGDHVTFRGCLIVSKRLQEIEKCKASSRFKKFNYQITTSY